MPKAAPRVSPSSKRYQIPFKHVNLSQIFGLGNASLNGVVLRNPTLNSHAATDWKLKLRCASRAGIASGTVYQASGTAQPKVANHIERSKNLAYNAGGYWLSCREGRV